ncbi:Zein-binding domain [Macleaya cordata]|uniref:Zein-binding domain n=1 Tax=Macleaya cordata TaxID=56857 RepID=A0A200Q724_MACCD|nr:Zein-binding domain [Macleaya cordata]
MASHPIHSWTFSSLVGAFLDLSLAYLLLCGSTLVFFTSKFLSIFGLYLPCPCNGLFNDPNGHKCINRLLVDSPSSKISSVHMSVKTKFPFDSILMKDQQGRQLNLKLLRERERQDGFLEMEGEASCSSFSDARAPIKNEVVGFGLLNSPPTVLRHQGISEVKGKAILNQKSRAGGIRRRRRVSSVSSSDHPPRLIGRDVSPSNYGVSQTGKEISDDGEEETLVSVNPEGNEVQYVKEAPAGINALEGTRSGFQMTELIGEAKNMERDASSAEEFVYDVKRELGLDGNEANSVRILEQALEEEHAARTALYMELEKERSAAASAADEAMAMILRLQEEKASIEMEARQYQRMIEEKSAYDAEEMNILKEILVRREREKHFLEKEVEAYRNNMLLGNEQSEGDLRYMVGMSGKRPISFDSSEDPMFMLQQISESISKKERVENVEKSAKFDAVKKQDRTFAFGQKSPSLDWDEDGEFLKRGDIQRGLSIEKQQSYVPECMDECKQEFQEKGMVSKNEHPSASQHQGLTLEAGSEFPKLNEAQGHDLHEKTIIFLDEDQKQKDNSRLCQGVASETDRIRNDTEISFPCDGTDQKKDGKDADQGGGDLSTSSFETEPSVYDVHVIDDESKLRNWETGKGSELPSTDVNKSRTCSLPRDASGFRRNDVSSDCPSTSSVETQLDIHRSYSDITNVLPPMDKSLGKALLFDLQKNSISAVDNERMKLETEVERLRERLRVVQEGREKLSFSVEHREREQIQLQLLEDIASQLREIRQLTEPGKAVRQASLPPPSSKLQGVRDGLFRNV